RKGELGWRTPPDRAGRACTAGKIRPAIRYALREASPMSNVAIEVAIGLVFCYASISVISSSLYEAIASMLKLRARSLLEGVKALLNDPDFTGLARDVYQHALVNPRSSGTADAAAATATVPSYIEPRAFAIALIDAIQKVPDGFQHLRERIDGLPDKQLRTML